MVIYTPTLRTNLEHFSEFILYLNDILFQSLGGYDSNASNNVQIGAEMKKLWPFENNYTKLKGHFEIISKFNL